MPNVNARYTVKEITDEGGNLRVLMRGKTQAEGPNTENPAIHPDAHAGEQLISIKLIKGAVSAIFVKNKDVLVNFSGPAS